MDTAGNTDTITEAAEVIAAPSLDVVCVGAALIDIIARTSHHPANEQETFVDTFTQASGGSAANTAVACAILELRAGFIGRLGIDSFGDELLADFRSNGVNTWGVVRDPDRQSGLCFIAIDEDGRRRMYAHSGAAGALLPSDLDADYLRSASVVHLADLYDVEPLTAAAEIAHDHATVCLNPGGLIASQGMDVVRRLLQSTDVFISSLNEASTLTGVMEPDDVINAVQSEGPRTIVLTLGAEGCIATGGGVTVEIPAFPVDVIDTTGAGDAFSAGFIYGLLHDMELPECCRWGAATAARCVETAGARLTMRLDDVAELARDA